MSKEISRIDRKESKIKSMEISRSFFLGAEKYYEYSDLTPKSITVAFGVSLA